MGSLEWSRMEKKRKRQIRNINSKLPGAIIEVILSKLPFFNLPSCRLVCKAWNDLVLSCKFDPSISICNLLFAHISPYHNLHCVDFDPKHLEGISSVASFNFHPDLSSKSISIINSCRGLLCLLIVNTKTRRKHVTPTPPDVCILNPITNEYIKLPIPKSDSAIPHYYGLGFCPKTNQYKLVRNSFVPHKSATLVEIFAFGTTSNSSNCQWTPVGFVPFSIEDHGVYFNGGLYFVGLHLRFDDEIVIYRLDIEHEKIQQISSPGRPGDACFIGVFNSTLYLTLWVDDDEYCVWKMEQDSDSSSSSSWIKAFSVLIPEHVHYPRHSDQPTGSFHLQLIKACEDGKILCLDAGIHVLLYDPNSQTTHVLTDQDDEIKKHMWVYPIDSFDFNSLHKILAGNT